MAKLNKSNSFFLFGARGTGKSTLLKSKFFSPDTLWIDLLEDNTEVRYSKNPDELSNILSLGRYKKVVVDEVQKIPKLLDIIQKEMLEKPKVQFILTGSSARKLRGGLGNLLAGRSFTYHLYPLTSLELKDSFKLIEALKWGTLPGLFHMKSDEDKKEFLTSYVKTYLKEEIRMEQLLRNFRPFRDFLEIAAQQSGNVVNFSNISRDVGVDYKTIANYFTILDDTFLGFFLPSFHRSIRKQQRVAPKFYFFDTGIKRALEMNLSLELYEKNYEFGKLFEHWVISECFRLNEYLRKDFRFSYLRTKDQAEIDLIIQRPGKKDILVKIKSSEYIKNNNLRNLISFQKDWKNSEAQLWSRDPQEKKINSVFCFHWIKALENLFSH